MNWQQWIRGLIAAAISAAAGSVTMVIVDPQHFNLFQGGARSLGEVAAVFAIVAMASYLKTHPLPDDEGTVNVANFTKPAAALFLAVALSMGATGCAHQAPTVTPAVQHQQQILKVLNAVRQTGVIVEQVQLGEQALYASHAVPQLTDEVHSEFQHAFEGAAETVLSAVSTLQAASDATNAQQVVQAVSDAVKQLTTRLAHLNTKEAARLSALLDTANVLVALALS